MRLLVLGGTGFLGPHVVRAALRRGWSVTTFNRATAPSADPRVALVRGDRADPADLATLVAHAPAGGWDVVLDTWSGAPSAVRDAAEALEPVAARYAYVSSGSVYADLATGPRDVDLRDIDLRDVDLPDVDPRPVAPAGHASAAATPTVAGDPDAPATDYAADKRGGELAAVRAFGDGRALLARAGLILGPGEDVGRLPWWLLRLARGGPTLAPGPPDLPVQLIDARDVAAFCLDAAAAGHAGPVNVAGHPGATTMREVLGAATATTGANAELVWVPPEAIRAAGIEPWTDLPLWLPPDHEARGMLHMVIDRALALGLRTRPVAETVADTWAWLRALDGPPPQRADRPPVGLDPRREREVCQSFTSP